MDYETAGMNYLTSDMGNIKVVKMISSGTCKHILSSSMDEDATASISQLTEVERNIMLVAAVFAIICSISGTLSNLITLLAVGVTRQMKTTATVFVLNLSVSEFLFCLIILPVQAAQYIYIYRYNCTLFTDDDCSYLTTIRYAMGQIQLQSIMAIAFTRAIAVGIPKLYKYINRSSVVKGYIAFIWIYSIAARIPIALGEVVNYRFGSYDFNNKTLECDISTDAKTAREVYIGLDVYFPIIFIFTCYIFILIKVKQSSGAVRRASCANPNTINKVKISVVSRASRSDSSTIQFTALNERDMRVLRSVFVIFIILLICAIPVGITHRGNIASDYPEVFVALHIMYWFQYSIDPIVYSIMNDNYRDAFKEFFVKILSCSMQNKGSYNSPG